MRFGCKKPGARVVAAAAAALWCLGIAGCGKTPAPQEPAKSVVVPPAPIAAAANRAKDATPPRNAATTADGVLAAKVRAALAADSRIKSFAIDVRAANGDIDLFGTVDSEASLAKAEKIAASVDGVKSVNNHLVLVSGS